MKTLKTYHPSWPAVLISACFTFFTIAKTYTAADDFIIGYVLAISSDILAILMWIGSLLFYLGICGAIFWGVCYLLDLVINLIRNILEYFQELKALANEE